MTDLGNEGSHALWTYDLVMPHPSVERGNKNARWAAGVREALQQLLSGEGHAFLQGIPTRWRS